MIHMFPISLQDSASPAPDASRRADDSIFQVTVPFNIKPSRGAILSREREQVSKRHGCLEILLRASTI